MKISTLLDTHQILTTKSRTKLQSVDCIMKIASTRHLLSAELGQADSARARSLT